VQQWQISKKKSPVIWAQSLDMTGFFAGGGRGIRTHGRFLAVKRFRVISRLCLLVEIKRIWKYTTEAKMLRYTADFGFRFSLLFEPTGLSEFFPFLP